MVSQPSNTKLVKHRVQKGETLKGIAKKYGVRSSDLMTWNHLTGPDIRFDTDLVLFVPESPAKEAQASAAPLETVTPQPPAPTTEPATPAAAAPTPPIAEPSAPKAPDIPPAVPEPAKDSEAPPVAPEPEKQGHPDTPPPVAAPAETPAPKPDEAAPSAEPPAPAPEPTTPPPAPPVEEPAPAPQTAAPESPPSPPAETKPVAREYDTYTVSKGDNLRRIAERFHIPEAELAKLNQISDPNLIKEGQRIKVPKQ